MATLQDIRVSKPLTDISVAYTNQMFIADQVLPRVIENRSEPFYYKWDKNNLRLDNDVRAPGNKAFEVDFGLSKSDNFYLVERSLKTKIPDEDMDAAKDADAKFDLKVSTTKLLNNKLLTRYEYQAAAELFSVTVFSGYTAALSGNDQWNEYGTSDPIKKIIDARNSVRKATGVYPNTVVLGAEVFDVLSNHPDILDRIKGGATKANAADVTAEVLAQIFKVDRVLVGGSIYNTVSEGVTDSNSDIWGKFALVCYVSPTPAKESPSLGYTFYNTNAEMVREWYDKEARSTYVEVTKKFVHKVVAPAAGYLYSTVIA